MSGLSADDAGHLDAAAANVATPSTTMSVQYSTVGDSIGIGLKDASLPDLRLPLSVTYELVRFPDQEIVWQHQTVLTAENRDAVHSLTAPEQAGIYQWNIAVHRRDSTKRWWPVKNVPLIAKVTKTLVVRSVQNEKVAGDAESEIQWTPVTTINPSSAPRAVMEAWQNIRHTITDNSWFELDLPWSDSKSPSVTKIDLSSPQATKIETRLRSEDLHGTSVSILPKRSGYQCVLPSMMDHAVQRLTVGFESSSPVHLSLQWFRDGEAVSIKSQRIDYVPPVDADRTMQRRQFVYQSSRPLQLRIVNLDRHSPVRIAPLEIQGKRYWPAEVDVPLRSSRSDALWVQDVPLINPREILASAAESVSSESWSSATVDASHLHRVADQLTWLQSVYHTNEIWIDLSAIGSKVRSDALVRQWSQLQTEVPGIRWVADEDVIAEWTDIASELTVETLRRPSFRSHLFEAGASIADATDSSVTLLQNDATAIQYETLVIGSYDALPSHSIVQRDRFVQVVDFERDFPSAERCDLKVAPQSHGYMAWKSAWRKWSHEGAVTVESVDPEHRLVEVHQNQKGQWLVRNRTPWRNTVNLRWARDPSHPPTLVGNFVDARQKQSRTSFDVLPRGIVVIEPWSLPGVSRQTAGSSGPLLKSWSAVLAGGIETVDEIKRRVTQSVERVGMLREPPQEDDLWSSSFSTATVGSETVADNLSPWLHAQHPPRCVRVVSDNSNIQHTFAGVSASNTDEVDMARCIELRAKPKQNGRTWMVSPVFTPDRQGRLAISLDCRRVETMAAIVPKSPANVASSPMNDVQSPSTDARSLAKAPLRLRIALEGIEDGQPVRFHQIYPLPQGNQWHHCPMVLETGGWNPSTTSSLRLAIDLLDPGTVRLDNVRVHRRFATTAEHETLQRLAFLAVQGFKRGNLTHSGNLLSNSYVDELLFRPEYQPKSASDSENATVAEPLRTTNEQTSATPDAKTGHGTSDLAGDTTVADETNQRPKAKAPASISKRWRGWWPQSLRF